MLETIPFFVNIRTTGPTMPLNENSFLIPFESREEVREVVKLGTFEAMTKDKRCVLNLAHWMAELGAFGCA